MGKILDMTKLDSSADTGVLSMVFRTRFHLDVANWFLRLLISLVVFCVSFYGGVLFRYLFPNSMVIFDDSSHVIFQCLLLMINFRCLFFDDD